MGHSEFRRRLAAARPRLYRTAVVWTKNRDLAEDLVQETAAKALKSARQLRDIEALESWLFRIMINSWRDHLRQNPLTEDIDKHELRTLDTPETDNSRLEVIKKLRAAVNQLPGPFRQTLMLVDLEGFSYIETAGILGVPVGTVMSRLSRARARLRDQLGQELRTVNDPAKDSGKDSTRPIRRVK